MIEVTTPSIPFSVMSNLPLHEVLKLGMVLESSRTERSGKTNKSWKTAYSSTFSPTKYSLFRTHFTNFSLSAAEGSTDIKVCFYQVTLKLPCQGP